MSLADKRLLLVEDSPTDAVLLERFLSKNQCDCQVKHVGTLGAACEALSIDEYDVVVLDLNLPDSVSLPTLHTVRSRFPQVPIIVLSGEYDAGIANQANELRIAAFLNKNSASLTEIATAIREFLECA